MRYGLGYRFRIHNRYFEFQPFVIGNSGMLIDLNTKKSITLQAACSTLAMSEKDVKILVRQYIDSVQ